MSHNVSFDDRATEQCAGEQLESVHVERQRAQAAYDLFDFFNSFSKDDTTRIDALKKEGREGRRQVATILRRLNIVAKEVDLPNVEKVSKPLQDIYVLQQLRLDARKHRQILREI